MAENNDVAAPPKKGRLKTILLLIIVIGLAVGLSIAGTLWFLGQGGEEAATAEEEGAAEESVFVPSSYVVMDKALVATVQHPGRPRYIQVYLALESNQEAALEAAEKHMPLLRNALISELGSLEFMALQTREGRQALPEQLLAAVNQTLEAEGEPAVDRILLRNFVIQ